MRFENVVVAYAVIGAVMWGAGLIGWSDAGVGQLFIESAGDGGAVEVNEETGSDLEQSSGPIQEAASVVSGALNAIWTALTGLLGFLIWPITVLRTVEAPPRIVVVGGVAPTMAFYATALRVIRGST